MMRALKILIISLITMISVFHCNVVRSSDDNIASVKVTVTVSAPPSCIINDNKVVEVNFGDNISINEINEKKHLKRLNYTLECKGITKNSMKFLIEGTPTDFDSTLLATTQQNLGIAFYNSGIFYPLNTWINFTYPDLLTIEAAPLKQENTNLKLGSFSATALIRVDYE
ncbi:fimbrial protein [Lelliottia nimipressuralis]|uniref:fimbrial protein n=1 Tax=Lelliottia nimipressuralis TaxID=69220 RepID=UPI00390604A4